jgi:hypothetical protein
MISLSKFFASGGEIREWKTGFSELKQVTFLTTRTARVTSKDWVKGCDWRKTSTLLPVDVRVAKTSLA